MVYILSLSLYKRTLLLLSCDSLVSSVLGLWGMRIHNTTTQKENYLCIYSSPSYLVVSFSPHVSTSTPTIVAWRHSPVSSSLSSIIIIIIVVVIVYVDIYVVVYVVVVLAGCCLLLLDCLLLSFLSGVELMVHCCCCCCCCCQCRSAVR